MIFKRMLCPVDFSDPSAAALRTAGLLAQALDLELTVLHAQNWEFPAYFTVSQTRKLQAHLRKSRRAARSYFQDFVKRNLPEELPRSTLFVDDEAVTAILRAAQDVRSDLIVMGTHGRTRWSRIRLGSVMEGVLLQAGIPVLAVGPHAKALTQKTSLRNILCPIDFGGLSGPSIEVAEFLAAKTGAGLTVLHIVESKSASDEAIKEAERRLCEWMAEETRGQCSTDTIVRHGSAVEAIVGEAGRIRSDLLIIGARPRQSLGAIMFGSTAESLIRNAPCPVLVTPAPKSGTKQNPSQKESQL